MIGSYSVSITCTLDTVGPTCPMRNLLKFNKSMLCWFTEAKLRSLFIFAIFKLPESLHWLNSGFILVRLWWVRTQFSLTSAVCDRIRFSWTRHIWWRRETCTPSRINLVNDYWFCIGDCLFCIGVYWFCKTDFVLSWSVSHFIIILKINCSFCLNAFYHFRRQYKYLFHVFIRYVGEVNEWC